MTLLLTRRCLSGLVFLLGLLPALACARPEVVLRERPAQRVEVTARIQGMTAGETAALGTELAGDLAAELGLSPETPGGSPVRVLRVTLRGGPDPAESWGKGRTWLATMAGGTVFGALLGGGGPYGPAPTSWKGPGIGAAVGLLAGAILGPFEYEWNQATLRTLGYLPWRIRAHWEVLDRVPTGETVVARSGDVLLELRPYLHPVPEGPGHLAAVRRENLSACVAVLARRIRPGANRR